MFQKMSVVIKETMSSLKIERKVEQHRLMDKWDEVVGEDIGRNTLPSFIKGETLFVEVSSSTWAQELNLMKQELVSKLNKSVGKKLIKDVRFKATGVSRVKRTEEPTISQIENQAQGDDVKKIRAILERIRETTPKEA